jgi:hypothetical protein
LVHTFHTAGFAQIVQLHCGYLERFQRGMKAELREIHNPRDFHMNVEQRGPKIGKLQLSKKSKEAEVLTSS